MKNQRKAIIGIGVTAGLAGAGALVSTGLVLSLHTNYKVPYNQTYFFTELKNQVEKTKAELEKFSVTENKDNPNEVKNLFSEIDYAKQLLANENSSVALMLQQRNLLKQQTPKALLSIVKDVESLKKLVEEYYSLVKDVDFQKTVTSAKNTVLSSLNNSDNTSTLKAFYKTIDPLIKRQNDFSFGLETKIWTEFEKIAKNSSELLTNQEKSTLKSTIEQILNVLAQPVYSRDALLEYSKLYDQIVEKLSSSKTQENKTLNNFYKNVIRVRNEIGLLNVKEEVKQDFFERIENYKQIALNPTPTLALTKSEEIVYLTDLVKNQLESVTNDDIDQTKTMQQLQVQLQALESLNVDDKLKNLIAKQVEQIQKDAQEHPEEVLNYISQAINLQSTVKNLEKLIKAIKDKIDQYIREKSITESDGKAFNEQLNNIILAEHSNVDQYLSNLHDLYNKIYDNTLLSTVFKNSLKNLKEQAKLSLDKGFEVDTKALSQIILEIDQLLKNPASLKDLNNALRVKSDQIRQINRSELKSLYNVSISVLNGESVAIQEIKDRLFTLNEKAKPLIADNSTAIREDLQYLIGEYKKELELANISEELQKTLSKHSKVRESVLQLFGGEQGLANSPFGTKLIKHIDELKKQAEIISHNPNLTKKEKNTQLALIRDQLDNIANNADNYKQLEQAIQAGNNSLDSSHGKPGEQGALQKEALKIKQLQNDGFDALNNAPSANNVADLVNSLNQAISDYKDKQAVYQSTKALDDYFKEINQVFAPYAPAGGTTPTQQKIIDRLNEHKKALSNPNLTNKERDQIHDQIAQLIDVLKSFKDLEVNNNGLKELIKDTEGLDFASFKPDSDYTNAKNLNAQIDKYLSDAFNVPFNRTEIDAKVTQIQTQSNTLGLAISVAFLKKTNAEIQANKITNTNLNTQSPYSDISASIETLNTQTNNVINNTSKTQTQVDELNNTLKNYINQAKALKASADKLSSLSQNTSPVAYTSLLNSITNKPSGGGVDEPNNSLINFGDSVSVIDFKTRILTNELSKTDTRVQVESNINKLKTVYTNNEKNRVIFDHAVNEWNSKITEFTNRLNEFYISRGDLAILRDNIDLYITQENQNKNAIQAEWDKVIAKKAQLVTQYDQRKKGDQLTAITKTQEIFNAFDQLVNAQTNGKYTSTVQDLNDKLALVPLGYAKDLFAKNADAITNKLNPFDNYDNSFKTMYPAKWKTAITTWVNAIKDKVQNYTSLDDLLKIQNDYAKLSSITLLIDQLKSVFDYFNNTKSGASTNNYQAIQNKNPNNDLFTKLGQTNSYTTSSSDVLYGLQPSATLVTRNELRDAFFKVVDLKDAKEAQADKITKYKTKIDKTIQTNNNLDPVLKTQIDNKLDELLNQTNTATDHTQLVEIDNHLSEIVFKETHLIDLARETKTSKDLVTANANIPANEAGKKSIVDAIKGVYDSYSNSYLTLTVQQIISHTNDLEDKRNLLNSFNNVYQEVNTQKTTIPSSYPDGTGTHGTGAEGKAKMTEYYDGLITKLNTAPVTRAKLLEVSSSLTALNKLTILQVGKIAIQANVKQDTSYNNFNYDGTNTESYGFDKDYQALADDILKSIPENNASALDIENTLYPNLVNDFADHNELYSARKGALDLIYKTGTVQAEKGIKTKQIEQLNDPNTNALDPQYQNLKTKADQFFHTQAQNIKNANSIAEIDVAIQTVSESDVFFDKYKKIAQLIAQASMKAKNQAIQNNQNVQASMTKLNDQITKGESYYYNQKDIVALDDNIFYLKTYKDRLDLATNVAHALIHVKDFNTTAGTVDYLTADAKTPLENILNKPFSMINADSQLETSENYARLLQQFVTGSTQDSYLTAFLHSKQLQAAIYKAQTYLTSYKTQKQSNPNYEPTNIDQLYTELETKINDATTTLNKNPHNETEKIQRMQELYNSNNGALDKIFKAIDDKIKKQYNTNLALDKYMASSYIVGSTSPKLTDYDSVAITPLETPDSSTPDKLVQLNSAYNKAIAKYKEQALKVYKWEANRYNSFNQKLVDYTTFLNQATTSNGIEKEYVLKVTGISDTDLNQANAKIQGTQADTPFARAIEYITHLTDTDNDILNWFNTVNVNTVIEELHSVGSDLFAEFQKLILITSVPHLLLASSQYEDVNEELAVDADKESVGFTLQEIQARDGDTLENINAINTSLNGINPANKKGLLSDIDESNVDFSSSTPQNIVNARKEYLNKYKDVVQAIAKVKKAFDKLIFGSSDTDAFSLKNVLHKFIVGTNNFDGRSDITNFLKYIADPSQVTQTGANDKFAIVKEQYAKLSQPAMRDETVFNNLNKNTASDTDIFNALVKGFSSAFALKEWMDNSSNDDLFFDWLSQTVNGLFNYEDIVPNDRTTIQKFDTLINDSRISQTSITIGGTDYDAKLLNEQISTGILSHVFEKFNALQGNGQIFNSNNVKVYIYKNKSSSTPWIKQANISDNSIRRGYVNLYFKFEKPANLTENTSSFYDSPEFGVKFENVGINFKTLDRFIIDKNNIKDTTTVNQKIFSIDEAGWNNLQAPYFLADAFTRYSTLTKVASHSNDDFFFEYVDQGRDNLFGPNPTSSAQSGPITVGTPTLVSRQDSTPNFRIKVKLQNAFRGYQQISNYILWKTLDPNVASGVNIQYQNSSNYYNSVLRQIDNTKYNWQSKYQYLYNAQKDQNKNLVFLPIIIGIPVMKVGNPADKGLLVLSWQIINRFSSNVVSPKEEVSLGVENKLNYAFLFKPTTQGNKDPQLDSEFKLASYIMNKIKYRDLVGLTFKDLTNSELWDADRLITEDTTVSSSGVIGSGELYNAIGQNGRFDIQFKLH
ncbi:hypothetical protein [Mycoplasma sp. 3686d]|uniref:hypothetical protein n=1 Tax=Mycoplasma sp. 3686d TaxID=2967300 RepID=UPI00211C73FF|nr:hypothetical protein [Mycoplasma sp. 3686d]UUM25123.1 hypothetical protein NPA12_01800 [Mycoplasma sp. 3686d]